MNISERVLSRFKEGSHHSLSEPDFKKAAEEVVKILWDMNYETFPKVRDHLFNISLTLKDMGNFRDASTLLEYAEKFETPGGMSLLHMMDRVRYVPDARKVTPKPGVKPKPESKPNPWTKPLK